MIIEESFDVGDIVLLRTRLFKSFPASSMTEPGRQHMFVIVKTNPIVVCPISSQMNKSELYKYAVPISDWQDAHLKKPSYVGVDNSGIVEDAGIFKKIGSLSNDDKQSIISMYQEAPQRIKLEQVNADLYEWHITI